MPVLRLFTFLLLIIFATSCVHAEDQLKRLRYDQPDLVVDLGVGLWAWPLPMDYDNDGDYDLVIGSSGAYKGHFFFENTSPDQKMPVFKPGVLVANRKMNVSVSYIDGKPRVLSPNYEYNNFTQTQFDKKTKLNIRIPHKFKKTRADQWKYVDYNGDGNHDIAIGIGDWTDYGWDNAFNKEGKWTNGPLHGWVYIAINNGTDDKPNYATPQRIQADGKDLDVYGMPSPNFADFDNDGDLDILTGEFIDKLNYFENIGSRTNPKYAPARFIQLDGKNLQFDLCMMVPTAIDWDRDGDTDLIVGQEDGRVIFLEHTGSVANGLPVFNKPLYFQQNAEFVKYGVLTTPVGIDWDNDGDQDIITGNTAGNIGLIENIGTPKVPKWKPPVHLEADGETILILSGYNGSIQGPAEEKWGYTCLDVADWDHDGLHDIIINSIFGKIVWYKNIGTKTEPKLAAAQPITVQWNGIKHKPAWNWWDPEGDNLVTQWRTRPVIIDLTGDNLSDLVILDAEGYLCLLERTKDEHGNLQLLPPKRFFYAEGSSIYNKKHTAISNKSGYLQLNDGTAGSSGRRKICFTDWDHDGKVDLLVDSYNVNFFKNVTKPGADFITLQDMGRVDSRKIGGHSTFPDMIDLNSDGVEELIVGAEDGYFYYMANPHR
ncbi:FG-GAP repeat domain-containing protein [Poriferisphaera sp. WC338]|uniref:FG-GAP repeat domain-containing protein n=1 Tax=Poriferisphaera sp. WC338 TaxID=3425129 RepID=UPI003D817EA7